jgi:hypothetical protein
MTPTRARKRIVAQRAEYVLEMVSEIRCLPPFLSKRPFHITGAVDEGEHLDVITRSDDSIDDSVIPENDFPEAGISKLRYNSAASRHSREFFSGMHERLDGSHGIYFRILGKMYSKTARRLALAFSVHLIWPIAQFFPGIL